MVLERLGGMRAHDDIPGPHVLILVQHRLIDKLVKLPTQRIQILKL